jgi:hypothetical protein
MNLEHRIACLRFMARGLGCDHEGDLERRVRPSVQALLDRVSIRTAKKYCAQEEGCWAWLAMYRELTAIPGLSKTIQTKEPVRNTG